MNLIYAVRNTVLRLGPVGFIRLAEVFMIQEKKPCHGIKGTPEQDLVHIRYSVNSLLLCS